MAASQFLSKRPVYRLSDENTKHQPGKAVLKLVKVENNPLLVELSVL